MVKISQRSSGPVSEVATLLEFEAVSKFEFRYVTAVLLRARAFVRVLLRS